MAIIDRTWGAFAKGWGTSIGWSKESLAGILQQVRLETLCAEFPGGG